MSVVLYNYWRSSASWRVRIALGLKGIAYEYRAVNLVANGGEQYGDEHRARNPMRELPTLEIDGLTLSQSLPIIEYLDETRPEAPLLPPDAAGRARCRQVAEIVNASIQPAQNLRILRYLEQRLGAEPEQVRAWAAHWIAFGFDGLEPLVAAHGGPYCLGAQVTLADLCLVPQVYNARRFGVDLAPYPRIVAIEAALSELPAFAAARPEAQADAPASSAH
jgi:maleylacetoacetate isomerase